MSNKTRMKLIKYSKKNLEKYINFFHEKTCVFFYDLDYENFKESANSLSECFDDMQLGIIKLRGDECLVIGGCLYFNKIQSLVAKLHSMDISEFNVIEYSDNYNIFEMDFLQLNSVSNARYKILYINKDEGVMQLYNIDRQ